MNKNERWLQWAVELQSIAQSGLFYGKDQYDLGRYEQVRSIACEMISYKTEIPVDKVRDLFCCEIGYQTPKLDTRAAIFKDGRILLVKENNGTWSLPGGWVDVDLSVKENVIKEVREEAGLDVSADMVIAVQDREKHNLPVYAYKVCKIFILCSVLGGGLRRTWRLWRAGISAWRNCHGWRRRRITGSRLRCAFRRIGRTTGRRSWIRKTD